ncbi:hypothetical protein OJAV_G00157700 [Oryzias javanicus]|uniref:Uncharacterized protein n=1 Tax=Oryzias javanicus TaxID=123683 RepID=A0A3S2LW74_ORYJA|nr:hypothetical protein OJAV_G00157700 [Oryzias javanicus]
MCTCRHCSVVQGTCGTPLQALVCETAALQRQKVKLCIELSETIRGRGSWERRHKIPKTCSERRRRG